MALVKINLNEVAQTLTGIEEGKEEVNIAQTKQVLKKFFEFYTLEAVVSIWNKYNKS